MLYLETHRATIQPRLVLAVALILLTLALVGTILFANGNSAGFLGTVAVTDMDGPDARLWDDSLTPAFLLAEDCGGAPARGVPAFPDACPGIMAAIAIGALAYLVRRRLLTNQ